MRLQASRITVLVIAIAGAVVLEAQQPVGDVKMVMDTAGTIVASCTHLAELITSAGIDKVCRGSVIAEEQAVLTKAAHTHVRMRPGEPDAVLDPNTLVRFDAVNRWLIRRGGMVVVNHRAKLELVAEGLGTLFVGSVALVEVGEKGVLVHVAEGSVILGASPSGIAVGASRTAWLPRGGVPVRYVPSAVETARLGRKVQLARWAMAQTPAPPPRSTSGSAEVTRSATGGGQTGGGGGGPKGSGGGTAAVVALGLGAAGAGAYFLTRDDQEDLKSDLVPLADSRSSFCQLVGKTFVATVLNQGQAEAAPSLTRVELTGLRGDARISSLSTARLAAGQSLQVGPLTLPIGCPCTVQITVDTNGTVDESNEGNNTATGLCIP